MKMKIILLTSILLLNSLIAVSQKENNIWYFGNRAGLDFNSGTPVNLNNGKLLSIEGCTSICNASGQLLFYSNGMKVWNRNHQVMQNGNNLKGNVTSTQ